MQLHAFGVDPAKGSTILLLHQRPLVGSQRQSADLRFCDAADLMQRKTGRVAPLQAAVSPVGSDESGDEVAGRVGEQSKWFVVLLEHAAAAEHGDLLTELERFVDVVRDEDDRLAQ